jgi:hypothetical protein
VSGERLRVHGLAHAPGRRLRGAERAHHHRQRRDRAAVVEAEDLDSLEPACLVVAGDRKGGARAERQAASWKISPSVVRRPQATVATPWRIATR